MRASFVVMACLALPSAALPAIFSDADEDKGGKGEKAPKAAAALVSKFTIAHALDEYFDGTYKATGKKTDGFNVYKSNHGAFLYPHHVNVSSWAALCDCSL